ncbi:MAG: dTDP-4-dehydrorhamnose reductase [Bacteriovoracia bacterium]
MILVTGSTGQLGTELKKILGDKAIYLDRTKADFSKPEILRNQIRQYKFDYLINAAAYTQVDKAESEREIAMTVNATSVGVLAEVCREKKAKLAHVSTDYVFSGDSSRPYEVNDPTNPVNYYGETKLRGEQLVQSILPESLVVRTSWVWAQEGKNFVNTILKLGSELSEIRVVDDQLGSPTHAADIAKLLSLGRHLCGTFHFSNKGVTSWYEFAQEIKKIMNFKASIVPIHTSEYPTAAKRPKFSVMKQSNELAAVLDPMFWHEALLYAYKNSAKRVI